MKRPTFRTAELLSCLRYSAFFMLLMALTLPMPILSQEKTESLRPVSRNPDCTNCHLCPNPTAENPCLKVCPHSSKKGASRVPPAVDYPEVVVLSKLSELYGPVVFAHKYHAEMCEMGQGCSQCHHARPAGEYPACGECHASTTQSREQLSIDQPGLKGAYHRQCLDCHIAWSQANDCGFCHAVKQVAMAGKKGLPEGGMANVPPARIQAPPRYVYETDYTDGPKVTFHHTDHVDVFGRGCVDCHSGDDCGRCHEIGRRVAATSDLHEACQACHQENDCAFCHGLTERPSFEHAVSAGWALGLQHQEIKCSACHSAVESFHTPSGACGGCHASWEVGSFDHKVTGLVLNADHNEVECENCHQDALYERPPTCDSCHDSDVVYPASSPGKKVRRYDRSELLE